MLLAWINHIDTATLAATSEISSLPVSNVQHPHLSRRWHTFNGVTSAAITADLINTFDCSLLGIIGTNLTIDTQVRVRASDVDPTALTTTVLDTGTTYAGVKTGFGAAYMAFDTVSARYWRIDIIDPSLANLQIGRVFLGPHWEPSSNMQLDWKLMVEDSSRVAYSYGGQAYSDTRPKRRVIDFVLDFMSEGEIFFNAFALARANGIVKDVLVVPDINSQYRSEQSVWGLVSASEPISEPRIGLYRQRFTITERL
jgi:hypothetical protein